MSHDQSSYETRRLPSGLGCALVLPTALFGTMMLADEQGPHGWGRFAELFGWWTLCVCVSLLCASLIVKFYSSRRRFSSLFAGCAVAVIFLLLTIAEAHPDTPGIVKEIATAPLQPLGIAGAAVLVIFLAKMGRASYRS
jgi:hypothetical protein